MNSFRRHPESLDQPKKVTQTPEPCPRCGDPGECDPKHFQSMVACRLGQIANQMKRFNDWLESDGEEDGDD